MRYFFRKGVTLYATHGANFVEMGSEWMEDEKKAAPVESERPEEKKQDKQEIDSDSYHLTEVFYLCRDEVIRFPL